MKQARVLTFCSLGLVLAFAVTAGAADRVLKLGTGSGRMGQTIDVPLTVTADGNVQGLVAAFDWDGTKLDSSDLVPGTVLDTADVVVRRVESSYAVLGVVMDSDGVGGEIIPLPTDVQVATLKVVALGPSGETEEVVPIAFKDKVYATVDLGPLLDNIIVIGGLSIGLTDGLTLTNGEVRLLPPPPGSYYVNNITDRNQNAEFGDTVTVPVIMGNNAPVQGFVVAIESEVGLTLTEVTMSTEVSALTPDFKQAELYGASAGVLAVVFELDGIPPFNTISAGAQNKIGLFKYATPTHACVPVAEIAAHKETYDLTFVDMKYGDPLQENVIVMAGLSKNPELNHGTITLSPEACKEFGQIEIAIGSCDLVTPGVDEPVEDWDMQDPTDPSKYLQRPGHIAGDVCDVVPVGFYYRFPPDAILDELDDYAGPDQIHQIQGLSIAVCYDKNCLSCLGTFSIAGTITETIGAEFVNVHCEDTDAADASRPGELIIGILADALPPFEGQYLPPTMDWLKLICVNFQIPCNAPCNSSCTITLCDGANGKGTVPIKNVASVYNHSWPMTGYDGDTSSIEIRGEAKFIRGDCNFNAIDHEGSVDKSAVDIADASAILSWLFQDGEWQFIPPCLDACDANDDGRVDLADSVYVLRYLFKFDDQPPEPFDDAPGVDPTDDRIDCAEGHICE